MSEAGRSRVGALVVVAVLGSAALAGGVYWVVRDSGPALDEELTSGDVDRMRAALLTADTDALKGEEAAERRRLTIEAMKEMPIEDLFALWRNGDLSDEDRELLGKNMRTLWMEHMSDKADEYFAASDDQKEALLDQQIDEWTEFGERMREYREAHKDDPEDQAQREKEKERWSKPSKEDRREKTAQTDPDRQAKMFYMFRKMKARAEERGIDFGMGRGGGGKKGGSKTRDRDSGRDRGRGGD